MQSYQNMLQLKHYRTGRRKSMASSFRDYFPPRPNSQSRSSVIPKEDLSKFPKSYQLFPTPDPENPFGPLPKTQTPLRPFRLWDDPLIPAPKLPIWPIPTLPSAPDANPFPDPSQPRLPPISPLPEPLPYDLDPSNFPGQGGNQPGGLLGRLLALHAGQTGTAAYGNDGPDHLPADSMYSKPPEEFSDDAEKPIRILARWIVR
jgi:hypothetical protein